MRYEHIAYVSSYFEPTNRTALHYFLQRWPLTARMSINRVSIKCAGVPRRRQDWTDPLPESFWPELMRILAPGQSVVVMQTTVDFSGVSVYRHILNSDRQRESALQYVLVRKFSYAEWCDQFPNEPYPYDDAPGPGSLLTAPADVRAVQVVSV